MSKTERPSDVGNVAGNVAGNDQNVSPPNLDDRAASSSTVGWRELGSSLDQSPRDEKMVRVLGAVVMAPMSKLAAVVDRSRSNKPVPTGSPATAADRSAKSRANSPNERFQITAKSKFVDPLRKLNDEWIAKASRLPEGSIPPSLAELDLQIADLRKELAEKDQELAAAYRLTLDAINSRTWWGAVKASLYEDSWWRIFTVRLVLFVCPERTIQRAVTEASRTMWDSFASATQGTRRKNFPTPVEVANSVARTVTPLHASTSKNAASQPAITVRPNSKTPSEPHQPGSSSKTVTPIVAASGSASSAPSKPRVESSQTPGAGLASVKSTLPTKTLPPSSKLQASQPLAATQTARTATPSATPTRG